MDTIGKSDPYCVVRIIGHSQVEKTVVIDNSDTPVWNATFKLDVLSYGTDILTIQMYDKDLARDDKMGKLSLQLYRLPPGLLVDSWYPLTPTKDCPKPGEIHITVQVALKDSPESPNVPFTPYNVKVKVIEARDLPNTDIIGKSDPYCLLTLVNAPAVFKTTVKKDTLEPHWDEETEFVLTHPAVDILHVLVRDEDLVVDDDMATLNVPLARFADLQADESWYPMTPAKGVNKGGELKLRIQIIEAPRQVYAEKMPGNLGKIRKK
jgi:Ca2+-dependent lipid-binding protein